MKYYNYAFAFILIHIATFSKIAAQADEFAWLEEVESERALSWVEKENKATLSVLDTTLYQEIKKNTLEILNDPDKMILPYIIKDYVYQFKQDEKHKRGVLQRALLHNYLKDSVEWETMLDIDQLAEQENKPWVFMFDQISFLKPSYNRCMIGLSNGGKDAVTYREFDIASKSFVENGFKLPEAKSDVVWKDINTVFVTTDFGPGSLTESGYPRIIKEWKRGQDLSEAKVIFEGDKLDVGSYIWHLGDTNNSKYLIYQSLDFFKRKKFLYTQDTLIELKLPYDAEVKGYLKKELIFQLKSDWMTQSYKFKAGTILSAPLDMLMGTNNRTFRIVYEPAEKESIDQVYCTDKNVIINVLDNVTSKLYVATYNKIWKVLKLNLPKLGAMELISLHKASGSFFFLYEDFVTPATLYYFNVDQNKPIEIQKEKKGFISAHLSVEQHFATSKDGTKVPYFMVFTSDMEFDGTTPTILYGYGGFEVSLKPYYSKINGLNWLEPGNVYVLANIRGGGEYGPNWHKAAMKENRQKAYDDFIAVSEDLISRKVTSPSHLGIMGGSNGGLLVGATFIQRPDLFNAVVCQVPLLDMKNYNKLLAGASWVGEYGNPDIGSEWAYIKKYSPYHNIKADVTYPKALFLTSTRDDRVHPAHARKMVAKMKAMGHPCYLYEKTTGGHKATGAFDNKADNYAVYFTYLHNQLVKKKIASE